MVLAKKLNSMQKELETLQYVITAIHYGDHTTAELALQELESSTNPYSQEIATFIRENYQTIKAQKSPLQLEPGTKI